MGATVGKLSVLVSANTLGLVGGMNVASASVGKFAAVTQVASGSVVRSMALASAGVAKLGLAAKATGLGLLGGFKGFLAIAGIAGVAIGLKSAAGSMDELSDASDRLGIGTESLIGLRHAANLAGVDAEEFTDALNKMQQRLGEAALEGGATAKTLGRLGFNVADLAKMPADQAFMRLADAFAAIENPAERAALVVDIFGRTGGKLTNMLRGGSEALEDAAEDARKLGMMFSRIEVEKLKNADDAVIRLKSSVKGAFQRIALGLSPAIEHLANIGADAFSDISKEAGESFGRIMTDLGFFVATWDLQWERIKITAEIAWDTIAAGGKAALAVAGQWGNKIAAKFKVGVLELRGAIGKLDADAGDPVIGRLAQVMGIAALARKAGLDEAQVKLLQRRIWVEAGGMADDKGFADLFAAGIHAGLDERKRKLDEEIKAARAEFDKPRPGFKPEPFKPEPFLDAADIGANIGADIKGEEKQFAGALVAGTTAAADAIFKSMRLGQGADEKVVENTGKLLDQALEQNWHLREIERAMGKELQPILIT